jgi:type IV secretion system protein TrbB
MATLSQRAEIERRYIAAIRTQLGQNVCDRLDDPDVIEVMLNPDGSLWEDRLGAGMSMIGTVAATAAESVIATTAASLRVSVTRDNPILECEPPIRGARFEPLIPLVVPAPVFTIRLKAVRLFGLSDYVAGGMMTEAPAGGYRGRGPRPPEHADLWRDRKRQNHPRQCRAGLNRQTDPCPPAGDPRGYGRDGQR